MEIGVATVLIDALFCILTSTTWCGLLPLSSHLHAYTNGVDTHTPHQKKKKDSALPSSILRKVWRLSDLDVPHGQLSELEFYSALKLIGVAQTGVAVIDRAALTLEGFEVPVFGAAAYVLPAILKTALGLSDSDLNEYQEQWATVYATSAGGGDGDADSGTFNEIPPHHP